MSNVAVITPANPQKSITRDMADRYGMEPTTFERTLRATVFPPNAPVEEFAAFLLVAKEYNLNPIMKEIYAYPKRGGGIVPVVSIDGWMNMINSHPAFDGMDFIENHSENGELFSIKCIIYRKDRGHPVAVTEYLSECVRATEPWKMKHRMLRHKSAIQCARYAFAFAGIFDEDEAEKLANARAPTPPVPTIEHERRAPPVPLPAMTIEHKLEPKTPPTPITAPVAKGPPKPPEAAPTAVPTFEQIRSQFEEAATAATDGEALSDAWHALVENNPGGFDQFEFEELAAIHDTHERRLAP
jgi:phage recombination protein Bet